MTTNNANQLAPCRRGHPRTLENTYTPQGRTPICRVCNKLAVERYRSKKRGPSSLKAPVPTAIEDLFSYSEESPSGLIWTVTTGPRSQAGSKAGSLNKKGYYVVLLQYKHILCHRIIWELHNGPIPEGYVIDHINGKKSDNRIANLRLATLAENAHNSAVPRSNRTGVKGLSLGANGKYQGQVRFHGKIYSRQSSDRVEVERWLREKREQLHGEFANHG